MMGRILMVFIMVGCLCLTVGCEEKGGEEKVVEEKMVEKTHVADPLTRQHLLEDYGITDEDLEGIEFDIIVKLEELSRNSYELMTTKEQVILDLKYLQKELEEDRLRIKNDKTYILNSPEFAGEMPELKGLKYLSVEFDAFSDDADKVSRFIDFHKKILYVSYAQSLVADVKAYTQIDLKDEVLEEFINDLDALGVREWQQNYDQEGREKYMLWDMGLEFQSGEVITIHGTLNEDGGYPDTFDDMIGLLQVIEKYN